MEAFSAKLPPTVYHDNITDGIIWLAGIRDKRKKLPNTKKKQPSATKFTPK